MSSCCNRQLHAIPGCGSSLLSVPFLEGGTPHLQVRPSGGLRYERSIVRSGTSANRRETGLRCRCEHAHKASTCRGGATPPLLLACTTEDTEPPVGDRFCKANLINRPAPGFTAAENVMISASYELSQRRRA